MEYEAEIFGVQTSKEGIVVSLIIKPSPEENAKEYNFHITRIHPGTCTLTQLIDSKEVEDEPKKE